MAVRTRCGWLSQRSNETRTWLEEGGRGVSSLEHTLYKSISQKSESIY